MGVAERLGLRLGTPKRDHGDSGGQVDPKPFPQPSQGLSHRRRRIHVHGGLLELGLAGFPNTSAGRIPELATGLSAVRRGVSPGQIPARRARVRYELQPRMGPVGIAFGDEGPEIFGTLRGPFRPGLRQSGKLGRRLSKSRALGLSVRFVRAAARVRPGVSVAPSALRSGRGALGSVDRIFKPLDPSGKRECEIVRCPGKDEPALGIVQGDVGQELLGKPDGADQLLRRAQDENATRTVFADV